MTPGTSWMPSASTGRDDRHLRACQTGGWGVPAATPMRRQEIEQEGKNESMCMIYYETEKSTTAVKGKVRYLPAGFWVSFFLVSLLPLWFPSLLLAFLVSCGSRKLLLTAAALIPCYCAVNARELFRAIGDKRIELNHVLKREKVELLRIREGRPYLYVTYRKDGRAKTKRFRIKDWRKEAHGPWVLDLRYMALKDSET